MHAGDVYVHSPSPLRQRMRVVWLVGFFFTTLAASRGFYMSRNGRVHLYYRRVWQLAGQNFWKDSVPRYYLVKSLMG